MASLNPNPTASRIVAINTMGSSNPFVPIAPAMASNLVLPLIPYRSEMPYNSKPDEKASNTKYLADASNERGDERFSPAITYSDSDINSVPRLMVSRSTPETMTIMP